MARSKVEHSAPKEGDSIDRSELASEPLGGARPDVARGVRGEAPLDRGRSWSAPQSPGEIAGGSEHDQVGATHSEWADGPALEYAGRDNLEVMQQAFNYNRLLLSWIQERARGARTVVDFGAGAGVFAVPLRRQGCPVQCVELDPVLRQRLRGQNLPARATLDGVKNGSVDFLYAFDVLEHIADDRACLRQWHEKLAPGGVLLLYVPAFQVLYSSMDRRIGHHRRYRRGPLREKVIAAGFQVEMVHYVDCLGFFGSLAYRLTDRGQGTLAWRAVKFYDRYVFPASRLLDRVADRWLGKNLLLAAHKPVAPTAAT